MSRNARTMIAVTAAVLISGLAAPSYAQQTATNPNAPPSSEGGSRFARSRERQARAPKPPSAEEVQAGAQAVLTATNTNCQMTESKLLGQSAAKESLYEVSCATGPGYLLLTSTPPQATDCMVLASSAEQARARDPNADVGSQCTLPANDNAMAVFTAFAQEAGLTCTVDEGRIIGAKPGGAVVYEIGCAGVDGAQINKSGAGWEVVDCLELASAGSTCRFTTEQEQAATVKAMLAGSDAASCDVTQVRYMGKNANGAFYEAACNGADGLIARVNTENAVQQVYPCETASQIGGGCKLTTTPPAATPNS